MHELVGHGRDTVHRDLVLGFRRPTLTVRLVDAKDDPVPHAFLHAEAAEGETPNVSPYLRGDMPGGMAELPVPEWAFRVKAEITGGLPTTFSEPIDPNDLPQQITLTMGEGERSRR